MLVLQSFDLSWIGLDGLYGDFSHAWFNHVGIQYEIFVFAQLGFLCLETLVLLKGVFP